MGNSRFNLAMKNEDGKSVRHLWTQNPEILNLNKQEVFDSFCPIWENRHFDNFLDLFSPSKCMSYLLSRTTTK